MKRKKKLAGKWLREMSRERMKPGNTRVVPNKKRKTARTKVTRSLEES